MGKLAATSSGAVLVAAQERSQSRANVGIDAKIQRSSTLPQDFMFIVPREDATPEPVDGFTFLASRVSTREWRTERNVSQRGPGHSGVRASPRTRRKN